MDETPSVLVDPEEAARLRADGAYLRRRYDAGESIRKLAAAAGVGYSTMSDMLLGAGTELRGRGGGGSPPWTAHEVQAALQLDAWGWNSEQISAKLPGRTAQAVQAKLSKLRRADRAARPTS